jgi:hypothetical protein
MIPADTIVEGVVYRIGYPYSVIGRCVGQRGTTETVVLMDEGTYDKEVWPDGIICVKDSEVRVVK